MYLEIETLAGTIEGTQVNNLSELPKSAKLAIITHEKLPGLYNFDHSKFIQVYNTPKKRYILIKENK
ncbi:MAG: hypothetical protein ACK5B9_12880 [Flavobacteriia bacterium]|jgi:hypothetical protein